VCDPTALAALRRPEIALEEGIARCVHDARIGRGPVVIEGSLPRGHFTIRGKP
jgi:hypothetical protein